jgi:hypothetical protein
MSRYEIGAVAHIKRGIQIPTVERHGVKIAAEKEGMLAHSKRKGIMHWNSP